MPEEWYDVGIEVEAAPGPPAVRKPQELDEVDKYRMPSTITAKWVEAQLTRKEWAEVKRTQGTNKLNPYLIESMCKDAKKGLSKRSVMARAGYATATWGNWERKAAEGLQPYLLWYQCMMLAYSSVEEEEMDKIRAAGHEDWKAAKWILETLNRDEYGATPSTQITNIHGGVKNESSVNYMSEDDSVQVAKLLQAIGAVPIAENVIEGEVIENNDSES